MDKFKTTVLKIWTPVKTKVSAVDKKVKIGVLAGLGVIIVSLIVLGIIMGQTGYSVLYNDVSSGESAEILAYIQNDLGVTDVKLQNDTILVPDTQVEDIRVKLSIAGYPKSTFNYDIWNNGKSMFSTNKELLVLETQQLEANLSATLRSFDGVNSAIVKLNIPEKDNYVISTSEEKSSASVALKTINELSQEQVDGMYNLVKNSVPGLEIENITITDGTGVQLYYAGDTMSKTDELDIENARLQLFYKRRDFEKKISNDLTQSLNELFDGIYDQCNVVVALKLNYDKQVSEKTEYTPSVDEAGTQGGMISDEKYTGAAGGLAEGGGVVGTTIDADISPDYPTIKFDDGNQVYWEQSKEIKHLVNEEKTQIEKDGYTIDSLSATVFVDNDQITAQEKEELQDAIANAIGVEPGTNKVTVVGRRFSDSLDNDFNAGDITLSSGGMNNAILLSVIIVLGVVLIVLLFLGLTASGSKKKRRYSHSMGRGTAKARPEFISAIPEGATDMQKPVSSPASARNAVEAAAQDFELHSLSEDVPETRDGALKREIRDFSKANPEIVAQLLRTWMRGED